MTAQTKKDLFWDYLDNTPTNELRRLEDITIEYLLRKKIGIEK